MSSATSESQRAELHKTIWRIANDMRGSVDGWDFKSYVLGMLFYRFISENLTAYINKLEREAGEKDFDYAQLTDKDAEFGRKETVAEKGFYILPSELFANVRRRAAKDENLNETLERVFKNIEGSAVGADSEDDLKGLFDDLEVNSQKLGPTVAKRNERLVKLLDAIGDLPLGNYYFWNCIQQAVRAGRSAKLACKTCLRLFPNWKRVGGGWQSVPPDCDWINDSWVPRERQDHHANWQSFGDKPWYEQILVGRVSAVFNYSSCPVRVCSQDSVTHKVVCIDSIPFSGNVTGKDADVVCDCDGTPRKVFDDTDWYVTDFDSWAKCGSTTTTEPWLTNFIVACREAEKLYGDCCRNSDGCKNRPFLYRRPNPLPHR